MTLEELKDFIDNYYCEDDYGGGFDDFYEDVAWGANKEIEGLGTVKILEDFGGEGMGDTRYLVFEVQGKIYRKWGYYASYDGTTWDGDLEEVKPVKVLRTEYEKV